MSRAIRVSVLVALGSAAVVGCEVDNNNDGGESQSSAVLADAIRTYGQIVHATYQDSRSAAVALDSAVEALVADPSEATLEAARQAWLDSREPYLQSEVFRFYEGPIDNAQTGPEGMLNAWPLDEAYIDYVEGDENAGVINDPTVSLDGSTLLGLNEQGGEKNIATGYHAIEFLLWGQDFNDDGPGDRPYTDYLIGDDATAPNGDRRGQYLTVLSKLLVTHLSDMVTAWGEGESTYRAEFIGANPDVALQKILTGMIILSGFETGGERLQTALDTSNQEDEHSCFSDNTHRDMIQDIRGIQNVYEGRYARTSGESVEGVGIRAVIAERDPELANAIGDQIQTSLALAEALPTPFDQAIAPENSAGRGAVEDLIVSLLTQVDRLEQAFILFELNVPVAE